MANESGKHILTSQWAEAVALWELGDVTLRDLKARFGGDEATWSRKFRDAGIVKGSKAGQVVRRVAAEVIEQTVDFAADDAIKLAQRKKDTKEDHYKWSEALARLVMKEVINASKENKPLGLVKGNIQALEKAAATLATLRKERYELLGLDKDTGDDESMPELVIRELTSDQIKELREAPDEDELDLESILLDEDLIEESDE